MKDKNRNHRDNDETDDDTDRKKIRRKEYEKELERMQSELCVMQENGVKRNYPVLQTIEK